MVTIKDKPNDVWGWVCTEQKGMVCYEDGDQHKITSSDIIFDHGKNKGQLLSEVSDFRYLNWMKQQGVDKDDWFLKNCAMLRLLELN